MSLLLEALKKAEKAKEEAARRAGSASPGELQLADDDRPGPAIDDKPVMTRNELPDITRPMEIHSEDLTTPPASRESEAGREHHTMAQGKEAAPDSSPAARKPAPARPKAPAAANPEERAAAKNVFEAKFKEPNPKLPFYITMAALAAFAVGTVVYFWYQLRPPPPLVNPNPPKPPGEQIATAPPPAPATEAKPPAAAQESPAPQVPGLASKPVAAAPGPTPAGGPTATAAPASKAEPAAAAKPPAGSSPPAPAAAAPRRGSAATGNARPQSEARPPADPSRVNVSRPATQVNPRIETGWKAYNEGNLPAARAAYEDALREEPANRDALLGMAAVEVRSRRLERAEALYQRLLDADPRDAHAQAGLLALRGQMVEPVQIESRVKSLLANDPDSHILHFTLGNQYSQQGRWAEAQQSYFKAYSADPENADFAYNLAVSLDQLRQRKLALEYYRRALALAQQRSGSFDQSLARNRVQELSR